MGTAVCGCTFIMAVPFAVASFLTYFITLSPEIEVFAQILKSGNIRAFVRCALDGKPFLCAAYEVLKMKEGFEQKVLMLNKGSHLSKISRIGCISVALIFSICLLNFMLVIPVVVVVFTTAVIYSVLTVSLETQLQFTRKLIISLFLY